ncbi:DUF397 domain-containing protein [Streptomyces sp. KMM 9044]|uniref:DUF397 domain-containing protein n=1 Tax=Streptomyces sp. KMM 9044 TaxID=2744474 RepID=UPI00215136A4|nr:DUF397 domain-containing protein [Streptomyces sp. KMM 9044]WAX77802.1 DUF397 domain-containing protein [Streptomyces sp. KMM 9044]
MSALKWIKSSYSEASGNNCVEVAWTQTGVALRDSERPADVIVMGRASLGALIGSLRSGSLGSGR